MDANGKDKSKFRQRPSNLVFANVLKRVVRMAHGRSRMALGRLRMASAFLGRLRIAGCWGLAVLCAIVCELGVIRVDRRAGQVWTVIGRLIAPV